MKNKKDFIENLKLNYKKYNSFFRKKNILYSIK